MRQYFYISIPTALIALDLFSFCHGKLHRNVTIEQAPGCKPDFSQFCNSNIFHVTAKGPNDTLHYLWDFTHTPSFLLANADLDAKLQIEWSLFERKLAGGVKIKPKPKYSFILILNKLIEFDDVDDTGLIEKGYKNASYDLDAFSWLLSKPSRNSPMIEITGRQNETTNGTLRGSVVFQMAAFGDESHDTILPRLLHSANSSQARVLLQGLSSNSGFNQSRWAIDLVIVSANPNSEILEVDTRKNLDDENSPGVFSVVEVITPAIENNTEERGFLQWRPVTYTALEPSITNSSDVAVLEPSYLKDPMGELNGSLAYKFYGSRLSDILVQRTVVSFGSSQDGFYKKTNFTSWAFLISYGTPQTDSFSMLVLLIMGIGLGLPAVLVLFGGVFICARRFARRHDELSLE